MQGASLICGVGYADFLIVSVFGQELGEIL